MTIDTGGAAKKNRVTLWMEDDTRVPDAENIHAAYERIVNEMSRFRFDAFGRLESCNTLNEHMKRATLVAGGGDEPFSEYDLPNGLTVCFSGERCSSIYVRTEATP